MVNPVDLFKGKNAPKIIKTDYVKDDGTTVDLEWLVKPLSPRLLVSNYEHFAALEGLEYKEGEDMSETKQTSMMKKLAPLIDVVLPNCCVKPKIVYEGLSNADQLNIDDVPLDTLMKLFAEIFKSSGLSEEAEKNRDSQKKVPSQKVLPPSVSITPDAPSHTNS